MPREVGYIALLIVFGVIIVVEVILLGRKNEQQKTVENSEALKTALYLVNKGNENKTKI